MKTRNLLARVPNQLSSSVIELWRVFVFVAISAIVLAAGYLLSFAFGPDTPAGLIAEGPTNVTINNPSRQKPVVHTFQLRNPTRFPIRIQSVNVGCACLTTNLDSYDVMPKHSVNLDVTIFNFDTTRASYHEMINVVTNKNSVALQIHGDLPLPTTPLYRPKTIFMEPAVGHSSVERDIILRVPKHLCRAISDNDVIIENCESLTAKLQEENCSELFREFRITLLAPANKCRAMAGRVRMETGCGTMEIEIRGQPEGNQ